MTNTPLGSTFASMVSVGATGYQQPATVVTPPRTVRYASPAPAAATFTDVPVGHPQRTFVEALVAAGVTGGCGAGTYCPDAAVTRGQMAVFLSVALGLHWPQ